MRVAVLALLIALCAFSNSECSARPVNLEMSGGGNYKPAPKPYNPSYKKFNTGQAAKSTVIAGAIGARAAGTAGAIASGGTALATHALGWTWDNAAYGAYHGGGFLQDCAEKLHKIEKGK